MSTGTSKVMSLAVLNHTGLNSFILPVPLDVDILHLRLDPHASVGSVVGRLEHEMALRDLHVARHVHPRRVGTKGLERRGAKEVDVAVTNGCDPASNLGGVDDHRVLHVDARTLGLERQFRCGDELKLGLVDAHLAGKR